MFIAKNKGSHMINLKPAVLLDGSENHSHRTFADCSFTTGNFGVFVKAPFLNSISLSLFLPLVMNVTQYYLKDLPGNR